MPGRKPFVFASGVSLAQSRSGKETRSRQWKKETFAQKSARANTIAARLARTYPELTSSAPLSKYL